MSLRSAALDSIQGISYGFGTLASPVPAQFRENWETKRPQWKQVHGKTCVEVLSAGQECGDADALFSSAADIPIAVQTADCVPILLASRDGKNVAAVHAGWRGTHARILAQLWSQLRAKGHRPENWVAAIGPSIGPCCYEVSEELAVDFERQFGDGGGAGPGIAVPRFRHLDLPAINEAELRGIGLRQIDLIRRCTNCARDGSTAGSPFFHHSYRREGSGCRQWTVIRIDPKQAF